MAIAGDTTNAINAAHHALAAASSILDKYKRSQALAGIATALAKAGDTTTAITITRESLAEAQFVSDDYNRSGP